MIDLTLGRVGSIVYPPGSSVGPRKVSEFQFVWILRGGAVWQLEGSEYDVRPGQLVLVQPGTTDRWQWSRSEPTTHGYAYFSSANPLSPDRGSWPYLRTLGEDDSCPTLLRQLLRLDLTDSRDASLAVQLVSLVLALYTRQGSLAAETPLPGLVESVVRYVDRLWTPSGIASPVTLAELADAAAVSPAHLCRVFSAQFGLGPIAVFEHLRLARAATLLTQSDLTTAAVARTCGFADTSHFSHRFRRAYGEPPGRYRQLPTAPDPSAPLAAAGLQRIAARLTF